MSSKKQYKTKQGLRILKCLEENKNQHMNVEQLMSALQKSGESVSQATVYRNLDKLVDSGLVLKFFISERIGACYQFADKDSECNNHYHLICTECGEVLHLDCSFFTDMFEHLDSVHNFKANNLQTVIYGLCAKCRQ